MNDQTIRKLKNKFILFSTLSFTLVMVFIAGCMYAANAWVTHSEARRVLDFIADNNGEIPDYEKSELDVQPENIEEKSGLSISSDNDNSDNGSSEVSRAASRRSFYEQFSESLEQFFAIGSHYASPEFAYSTRYFAVTFDESGSVEKVITSHTAAVEPSQAVTYANTVMKRWFKFGSYDDYYYMVSDREAGGDIVVVLDCSTQVSINRRLVLLACILIGLGMVISTFVIRTWAGRIIAPEIKNAELQKSFITNASHELKTPLAVIRANTEMLEMMGTENEWTQSTMRQVDRLTGLIQNLVLVTRASEKDSKEERVYTDFTAIIKDTAKTFEAVATADGKTMDSSIAEGVGMLAHEGDIRQIATLLIDNAIKYCDDGGKVTIGLGTDKKKKNI